MKYVKLKGTYDLLPDETEFFDSIENKIIEILKNYGYYRVSFPIIEYSQLFTRGVGDSSDIIVKKEMYIFEDKGKRLIALRPEGTSSAVRMFLENNLYTRGHSIKIFYNGPMFRAENPQAGRYRQFYQIGAEYFGDQNPYADVELILLNYHIFKNLGLNNFEIFINSIGCKECRNKYLDSLKNYYSNLINELCDDCKNRYNTNVLRILDCKEEKCSEVNKNSPNGLDYLCEDCRNHFNEVQNTLTGLNINYKIDNKLVRGLDYYNKTVFEIKSPLLGAQSTISAGGRYDYLIELLGGMSTPAVGFALGMERVMLALEKENNFKRTDFYNPPFVYIAFIGDEYRKNAMSLLELLRKNGIKSVTEYKYNSLKKHLKSADAMKVKWVIFVGENEVSNNQYVIRNMSSGEQIILDLDSIVNYFKNLING